MTPAANAFLTRRSYPKGREEFDIGLNERASLAIARSSKELRLQVHFSSREGFRTVPSHIRLCISPTASAPIRVTGLDSPLWHMSAGLMASASRDVFSRIFSLIYSHVVRRAGLPYDTQLDLPLICHHERDNGEAHHSQCGNSVLSAIWMVAFALRRAARHAAQLFDPSLLALTRRFSPAMRPWLYRRLAEDESRRLAQLATTAPGALVFAYAAREYRSTRGVGEALLEQAIDGVRLNRLLTGAVSHWASAAADWDLETQPRLARPWLRISNATAAQRSRFEVEQRLLIRRAGPRTSPTFLLLPPPLAFAPEDIPKGVFENARWFRTLKSNAATFCEPFPDQDEALLHELAHFASRHFRALHPPRRRSGIHRRIGELIDYTQATRRHTSRNTSPQRLLAESKQWHRELAEALGACSDAKLRLSRETAFPETLPERWSGSRVVATKCRTVSEVIELGGRMKSCIGSRAKAALQGRCSIYTVVIDGGAPIAVELTHLPKGGSYACEMAGVANRPVTRSEVAMMQPWLSAIGARRA